MPRLHVRLLLRHAAALSMVAMLAAQVVMVGNCRSDIFNGGVNIGEGSAVDGDDDGNERADVVVVVASEGDFGFFLPPEAGQLIGDHESDGIAFCSDPAASSSPCRAFPDGFIVSAHLLTTDSYIQVTGRINGTIYTINTDGGGQYDHNNSPINGTCFGYPFFVNLVEPNEGRYCIRCCENKADCPTGKSTFGCPRIISGDYT